MTSFLIGCNGSPTNQSDQNGSQTKPSNQNVTFSCENKDQDWTTTVKNGQQTSDLIIWQRTDFVKVGFPPERRCQEVTPRLQEAHDNGSLPSVTYGEMLDEKGKKQQVLCTDDQDKKQCKTLILTLLAKDDPQEQLKKFTAVLNGDANGAYLNSSCENIDGRLHCSVDIKNVFNKKK
ncbi:MAG TPA: COP23 domain-containing protein [Allocoleopsis sp.]